MEAEKTLILPTAEVDFDGARPVSRRFGDIYFDADGAAEVARVFLAPADFAARTLARDATFTVAELGFGTGLGFAVAAALCRSRLHFVSFERYPLDAADLARALMPWRTRYPLAAGLAAGAYPPPVKGWHRRAFNGGRVRLSVYFGDAGDGLREFAGQQRRGVDAWFLDGFAPAKNPDMWRTDLFAAMAALSAPGATVTSFSAAGHVRRNLAAQGFEARRVQQQTGKRHTTAAVYRGRGRTHEAPRRARVVGAGLAGAATARALAEKGIATTLCDGGRGLARGASAIPAALLHMRLLPGDSPLARFRALAYDYASHRASGLPGAQASGALQLPGERGGTERLLETAQALPAQVARLLDPRSASSLAGLALDLPGLLFEDALTIAGTAFARGLVEHPLIEVVADATGAADVPTVYATGADTAGFDFLEVAPLAGQIDRFASDAPPELPIAGRGVFLPAGRSVWAGATYEHRPWPAADATSANAERWMRLSGRPPGRSMERFRGVRAATSDRLPAIGRDGAAWFNLGHGSHGTVTALLGAEIVASGLNGDAAPADREILDLLAPGRFRERQRRRPSPFLRHRRST